MIHVPDVRATVAWYTAIGFSVVETYDDGGGELSFAVLSFGSTQVMFNAGGRVGSSARRDVDLYLYCTDVDGIFNRLKDQVEIIEAPHDTFYLMREISVRDVNGFWVTFGEHRTLEALLQEAGAGTGPRLSREALERYVGSYIDDATGLTVRIIRQDDVLVAFPHEGGSAALLPVSETEFKPLGVDDARVVFDFNAGRVEGLRFTQPDVSMNLRRVDDMPPH